MLKKSLFILPMVFAIASHAYEPECKVYDTWQIPAKELGWERLDFVCEDASDEDVSPHHFYRYTQKSDPSEAHFTTESCNGWKTIWGDTEQSLTFQSFNPLGEPHFLADIDRSTGRMTWLSFKSEYSPEVNFICELREANKF